ncbi:MAG: nucleotide sugar dehydrogenase [Candidatus Sedimenticola sp. (ex Thyasira tokunagai)]
MSNIAVIGLGYVGLPLASLSAKKGHRVVGLENNRQVVDILRTGKSHIRDEAVERLLDEAHDSGNFHLTADVSDTADCTIYLICVPTPVDGNNDPDLQPLIGALETIAPTVNRGDLVVVESTVFPGTCEEIALPILEERTGLCAGEGFHLAHCPERVNPGDTFWTTENIPRVVGATSDEGAHLAAEFYVSILGGELLDVREIRHRMRPKFTLSDDGYKTAQLPMGSVTMMRSIRDAEAVKAMENTVRDVNIAFVNELAKISDVLDLDVVDIIDGMSTKPFGKGPFFPGAGVGGHCIAVDPEWLKAASKRAGYMPELIQLSRNTNNSMPEYTVYLLQDALNDRGYATKDTRVAVLGVAYKKNVDDTRESPFYEIRTLLEKKGADIAVYDSWIPTENSADSLEAVLDEAKAVVIVTDHDDAITALGSMDLGNSSIEVIIDGRNCLNSAAITEQGILYKGIGRR